MVILAKLKQLRKHRYKGDTMTEKQEKIALIIEVVYSLVWVVAIIGSFVVMNDYWIVGLIILNTGWLVSTLWLVFFSSATDKVAGIAICMLLAGSVLGGIVNGF